MHLQILPWACLFIVACGGKVNLGSNSEKAGWKNVTYTPDAGVDAGTAEVQTLYDGGDLVIGIAADDTTLAVAILDLYSADRRVRIQACDVTNCAHTLRTLNSSPGAGFPGYAYSVPSGHLTTPGTALTLAGNQVIWVGESDPGLHPGLQICPVDGCPNGPRNIRARTTIPAIATDLNHLYWLDIENDDDPPGSYIRRCVLPACDAPTRVELPPAVASVSSCPPYSSEGPPCQLKVAQAAGMLFMSFAGGIARVPLDFSAPVDLFYASDAKLDGLAVVDKYVYFTKSTLAGEILRCPIDDCSSGPEVVASGQRWPNELASDGTDIYWVGNISNNVLNSESCDVNAPNNPCRFSARAPSRIEHLAADGLGGVSSVVDNLDNYASCPLSLNTHQLFWCSQRELTSLASTIRMVAR